MEVLQIFFNEGREDIQRLRFGQIDETEKKTLLLSLSLRVAGIFFSVLACYHGLFPVRFFASALLKSVRCIVAGTVAAAIAHDCLVLGRAIIRPKNAFSDPFKGTFLFIRVRNLFYKPPGQQPLEDL